ncbi:hypothetical protein DRO97_03530 [Archaeoglobales archaeon]|nr:MAG: hypothetical protein DRO97_03530 [Archaeoglobales archaeon]
MERLKREIEFLRDKIKEFKKIRRGKEDSSKCEDSCTKNEDRDSRKRNLKIAYIGGLYKLKQQYEEVAKSLKCELHYHNGNGRKKEIRKIVRKCDLVFCFVDVNSHNGRIIAKKICQKYGKPCIFLRSSSITSFKQALMNLAYTYE